MQRRREERQHDAAGADARRRDHRREGRRDRRAPRRGDGALWQALYGSRPWRLLGEGPIRAGGDRFNEGGQDTTCTPRDVRRGTAVRAFALGWPDDGVARFPALAHAGTPWRVTIPGNRPPPALRRTARRYRCGRDRRGRRACRRPRALAMTSATEQPSRCDGQTTGAPAFGIPAFQHSAAKRPSFPCRRALGRGVQYGVLALGRVFPHVEPSAGARWRRRPYV